MNTVFQTADLADVRDFEGSLRCDHQSQCRAVFALVSNAVSRLLRFTAIIVSIGAMIVEVCQSIASLVQLLRRRYSGNSQDEQGCLRIGRGVKRPGGKGSERGAARQIVYQPALNLFAYICDAPLPFRDSRGVAEKIYIEAPRPVRDSRTFLKKFYKKISQNPGNGTRVAPFFRRQAGARKVHAGSAQVLDVQGVTGGGNEVQLLARGQFFQNNRRGRYGSGLPAGFISRFFRFNSGARNQLARLKKAWKNRKKCYGRHDWETERHKCNGYFWRFCRRCGGRQALVKDGQTSMHHWKRM